MTTASPSPSDEEDLVSPAATLSAQAVDLTRRADAVLSELDRLTALRQSCHLGVLPGQKTLVQSLRGETASLHAQLDTLSPDKHSLARLRTTVTCSNVPALATTWSVVARLPALTALCTRFSRHPALGRCPLCPATPGRRCPPKARQRPADLAFVDAVVAGGAEWLRVVGVGRDRLLQEMAAAGWDWGAEDEDGAGASADDDECEVPLALAVRALAQAARANRHRYRPPRVRLVLPRIAEGRDPDVDRLLRLLRRSGGGVEVVVDCAGSALLAPAPRPAEDALRRLVGDGLEGVTGTVSLDCSVLIALVSDVTHATVGPGRRLRLRGDVARQAEDERERGSSLVRGLYPALQGRRLVCVAAAAARFREIVRTIGSPTEQARAAVVMDGAAGLQALSGHPVDPGLRLPVEVVPAEVDGEAAAGRLPAVAEAVGRELSGLNREVCMYGWAAGLTTFTANGTLAKQIQRLVEEHRTSDDEEGPNVWVHADTRALATKDRVG